MSKKSKLQKGYERLDQADRETHDALTAAEDELVRLEDRLARRGAQQTADLASRYPAATAGRGAR